MAVLTHADLGKFFTVLARRLPCPVKLIITGGIEAMLLGGTRPTGDIDFGLVVSKQQSKYMSEIEAELGAAAKQVSVAVQYSTDLDRWSPVAIPGKKFKTLPYKHLGKLTVDLLDPRCWAVYKLARYLDSDVTDLAQVLKRQKVSWLGLAQLCGECLRSSPRSPQLLLFRKQVEHFFREHGPTVWGKKFDSERAVTVFHRAAKIHLS